MLERTVACAIRTVPFYSDYPEAKFVALATCTSFRSSIVRRFARIKTVCFHAARRRASVFAPAPLAPRAPVFMSLTRSPWPVRIGLSSSAMGLGWYRPRHPRITLFRARIVPAQSATALLGIQLSRTANSDEHLSSLRENRARLSGLSRTADGYVLEGFPSTLGILADFCCLAGKPFQCGRFSPAVNLCIRSPRAKIQEAFATRVFDTYGMTEYCGLIQECERGEMHLIILNTDSLKSSTTYHEPVALGEEGFFVWTGFLNEAMPLIRYRIGDRGRWQATAACACGRSFPLVVPSITRESELLRCPDGRLLSARALNQLLKQSAALQFCQFVHDRANHLSIRAVARAPRNNPIAQPRKAHLTFARASPTSLALACKSLPVSPLNRSPSQAAKFQ